MRNYQFRLMAPCFVELVYGKIIMNNELENVRRKMAMTFYEVLPPKQLL
jgi:hypothetical protein